MILLLCNSDILASESDIARCAVIFALCASCGIFHIRLRLDCHVATFVVSRNDKGAGHPHPRTAFFGK